MQQRYYALDVFRGATVALMILVNNPGSWSHIFTPLAHASWHGCTPTDLVFPFFLFAVGNAMSFSMEKFKSGNRSDFLIQTFKRSILLFAIGILLNWSPFLKWDNDQLLVKTWSNIRIPGVLQRIGICFLFASLMIYFLKPAKAMILSALLLLVYWGLCLTLGNPDDPFSLQGYFGSKIDLFVFGQSHIYKGERIPFDPEGLMSSISAIVQVMLGYFIGNLIRSRGKNFEMLSQLFFIGILFTSCGLIWDLAFPINKKIWTSSYVLYTAGLATLTIATLIYMLEFKSYKGRWSGFFNAFGKNPLFIFVLSGVIPRVTGLIRISENRLNEQGHEVFTTPLGWLYQHIFKPISGDFRIGSMMYALFLIFVYWAIVFLMDKKKIYIKV